MNPIIEAIDAGHYNHAGECVTCKVTWPCEQIRNARKANDNYRPPLQPKTA